MLAGQRLTEAEAVASRLRLKTSDLRIRSTKGPVRLTCSFGASEWSEGETVEGLLKRADIALYEAKTTGRNRVVSAMSDLILSRTA
jgi:diguanylate cyclase (GGDEF)-like protein